MRGSYCGAGDFLASYVRERGNILIAGGTAGKTTLANALLHEVAATGDRVIILEDTVELQCCADDHVPLRTRGVVSMAELVRSTLRLRPDRIVIGEVRGRRSICSRRGERGIRVASPPSRRLRGGALVARTADPRSCGHRATTADRASVNVIVYIAGRGRARRVDAIVRVTGLTASGYHLEPFLSQSGEPQ